ncbi:MAG: hypothetical protein JOZ27_00585 [Caulobacteraceae bacterium]|nr:hypothetical protein [Caulobacteraceae bacterium]
MAPAHLEPIAERDAWLTIHEGRYHQVRRMFAAVGVRVETLHRDRVGLLDLPGDLGPGEWREARPDELLAVFGG